MKDQFQFIRYSWFADYPDPENFVFLLYGPNRHPGPNHAGYDNPAYDRLFERMRAMEDGPERLALIRRLRDIAARDCPWVYAWHDVTLSLHYDWLTNVKPHPMANDVAKYLRVDGGGARACRKRGTAPTTGRRWRRGCCSSPGVSPRAPRCGGAGSAGRAKIRGAP